MSYTCAPESGGTGAATGLRAVILAGGKGTRLRPFTVNFPKALVPLGDTPVVEILIRQLINHGITDITLALGHLAELVKAYFQHRGRLVQELNLRFIEEEEPTGTAGALALVPGMTGTFLTLNGDVLTNLDLHALVEFHRRQQAMLTIAVHSRQVKVDLGVLEFDAEHRITRYLEKPETIYHVSMGVYVYEASVLDQIEPGRYLDFPTLVGRLLERGERVCAYPTNCLWLDIGRADDYAQAQELFEQRRHDFNVV